MWPRKLLDITWPNLLCGGLRCLWPGNISKHETNILNCFGGPEKALVCLSVRSGFDLLLQSLQLPAGSEVIMSAVTIPDMVRIVKHHGLVPVPVDLDFETLAPPIQSLTQARTARTKLIVIAPLFGTSIPMEPIITFARENNVLVVEDCAQSFRGWDNIQSTIADVSLYSFGPIKTSTALGGAVATVHDERLLSQMRRVQASYPLQSRFEYAQKVMKYSLLKLASARSIYSIVFSLIKMLGRDPDTTINQLAKNFSPGELIKRIRARPAKALVALLARQQKTYPTSRINQRMNLGKRLTSQLRQGSPEHMILIPGTAASEHSHWVFPLKVAISDRGLSRLRKNGFDVTTKHNLTVIDSAEDTIGGDVPGMRDLFSRIAFLPVYPEFSSADIDMLAQLIQQEVSIE
ncbi:MAG: DegT/DnrJ/EryC1/StrS family aminotransferase [Pirellula sp.]|jgi:dTDP-4-amino-4,6-dideoxygalactose transaminase|nr:DegT/DnrJ/EryC1/StrS family aminotransferase [Pirellula sp.]